jgi:hypothetical protein
VLRSAIQDVLNRPMPAGKGGKAVETKTDAKSEGANDA